MPTRGVVMADAAKVLDGMLSVAGGAAPRFLYTYRCDSPTRELCLQRTSWLAMETAPSITMIVIGAFVD